VPRVEKILKDRSELQKKLSQKATGKTADARQLMESIEGVPVIIDLPEVESVKELRPLADQYKNQMGKAVVLLGAVAGNKATVVVSISKDIAEFFDTNTFVAELGARLGGKGGGRADFAQAGGPKVEALTKAHLRQLVEAHIKSLTLTA